MANVVRNVLKAKLTPLAKQKKTVSRVMAT